MDVAMFEDIDLNAIHEENARELIKRLLNLIEQLSADLRDARAEIQRLRDEVNRLKGGAGEAEYSRGTNPKVQRAIFRRRRNGTNPSDIRRAASKLRSILTGKR